MKINNRVNIDLFSIPLTLLFVLSVTALAQQPAVFDINGNDDRLHSKASIQRQAAAYHASKGAEATDTAEAHRPSAVDFDIFNDILLGDSDTLELELPDGTILVGEVADKVVRSRSTYTLTGYIQGDIPGEFLASVNGKVLAALVILSDGRTYDVRYTPGGYHVLRSVDTSVPLSCGAIPAPEDSVTADTSSMGTKAFTTQAADDGTDNDVLNVNTQAAMAADDGTYIDVLNVYTQAARFGAGGKQAIEAILYLNVDFANLSFANSLIDTRLRIVHMEEVYYEESPSLPIDFTRFQNPDDGYMDEVFPLRDAHGADLAFLTLENRDPTYGGVAVVLGSLTGTSVFAALDWDYPTWGWAHEIGHNLGCHHAVGDGALPLPQGAGIFNYSHGWRFDTTDGQKRTVMAYSPGTNIPHFSNPDVNYFGVPTGQTLGLSDEAHNALTINTTAPVVSGWRVSVLGDNTAPFFLDDVTVLNAGATDEPYNDSLAGSVHDREGAETLTFSKVSGPAWLAVAGNGDLSGTPTSGDLGFNTFTVRATDSGGAFADGTVLIIVVEDYLDVVIISSDGTAQEEIIDLLRAEYGPTAQFEALDNGYTILDAANIARLEAADQIIFSNYSSPFEYKNNAGEIAQWNAFSTPILLHENELVSAAFGWGWSGAGIPIESVSTVSVIEAADPLFDGVTINNSLVTYQDQPGTLALMDPANTLGTVLATPDGSNNVLAMRWTGAENAYYTGGAESPGGPRMYLAISPTDPVQKLSDDGDRMLVNAATSLLAASGNQPPVFVASVITKSNATAGAPYSDSIAGDASDPGEGDALVFLATEGPAWLSLDLDGTLTGTPTTSDLGENFLTVQVIDAAGGIDEASVRVLVDGPFGSYYDFATSDIAVSGTVTGTYTDTHANDGVYQSIAEVVSSGSPSSRYSYLEHKWTFNVTGGEVLTLVMEAYHTLNTEGDAFSVYYSTDDTTYYSFGSVARTYENEIPYEFPLPVTLSGPVYVRIEDDDQMGGNSLADSFYVDYMYIRSDDMVAGTNQPPSFSSDPVVKPDATENQFWSDSLAGDATDPAGDTLTFSKVSGPAWLTVAADGTISGTPDGNDLGLNRFTVKVEDPWSLFDTALLDITVVASGGGTNYIDLADSDIPVSGTVSGTYTDTHSNDGVEQRITEVASGGNPNNRISYLEHKWTVNVTGGDTVTFSVTARRDPVDFEYFLFAYSTDDVTYKNMVVVSSITTTTYSFELPSSLSGLVYIRAVDSNQSPGQSYLANLDIDHMYIESVSSGGGDTTPPNPDPMTWFSVPTATSSSSISMIATTATDASGVEFYFANLTDPAHDSGWQSSTSYLDTGLTANTSYTYTVKARDLSANQNETAVSTSASATTQSVGGPVDYTATSDIAVSGTVSGDYTNTQISDNVYESITEVESGGKPSNRYSYLEHKWTVSVGSGTTATFFVEAYRTANTEGDDFVFAYSTDDVNYTNMVTVTKTSDDDVAQSYVLPGGTSGTVYIRVLDTDRSAGNKGLDTIYVDDLYIRTE